MGVPLVGVPLVGVLLVGVLRVGVLRVGVFRVGGLPADGCWGRAHRRQTGFHGRARLAAGLHSPGDRSGEAC